jgi:hypothetical protein
VALLPGEELLPRALVHLVVNCNDHVDVGLDDPVRLALAHEAVPEHLRRGVEPGAVRSALWDARLHARSRQGDALAGGHVLVGRGHHVRRVDLLAVHVVDGAAGLWGLGGGGGGGRGRSVGRRRSRLLPRVVHDGARARRPALSGRHEGHQRRVWALVDGARGALGRRRARHEPGHHRVSVGDPRRGGGRPRGAARGPGVALCVAHELRKGNEGWRCAQAGANGRREVFVFFSPPFVITFFFAPVPPYCECRPRPPPKTRAGRRRPRRRPPLPRPPPPRRPRRRRRRRRRRRVRDGEPAHELGESPLPMHARARGPWAPAAAPRHLTAPLMCACPLPLPRRSPPPQPRLCGQVRRQPGPPLPRARPPLHGLCARALPALRRPQGRRDVRARCGPQGAAAGQPLRGRGGPCCQGTCGEGARREKKKRGEGRILSRSLLLSPSPFPPPPPTRRPLGR